MLSQLLSLQKLPPTGIRRESTDAQMDCYGRGGGGGRGGE